MHIHTVAAVGPDGTYEHQAACGVIGRLNNGWLGNGPEGHYSINLNNRSHFEVFDRAMREQCLAVVPIDNTTLRLWLRQGTVPHLRIIGEIQLSIRHRLLARPGVSLGNITSVLSHARTLAQCKTTLSSLGLRKTIPVRSIAEAAALLVDKTERRHTRSAALASWFTAGMYHLETLKEGMEDELGNKMRFHILGTQHSEPTGKDRTAVICWKRDVSRPISDILLAIEMDGVKVSHIRSVPLGALGQDALYLEFNEHLDSYEGQQIFERLSTTSEKVFVLGSYPRKEVDAP